ncbi:MAG: ABC transporter ATP-binding protein [Proteobacteria bacterium]|nr:ABC transporter ATP-binding protein [Pseudomonadota bacterium]
MVEFRDVLKFYQSSHATKLILDHVTFQFERGMNYGILGVNGAGKSTLMRMVAGTEMPNAGAIRRHCRISWPLGFTGSLHPEMSGRENVSFVARIYGMDRREVLDFVRSFSEIGGYIDAQVKTYSSGMLQRLAFGLSIAINFDCFLIDEVIAVGDARFQERCRREFDRRRAETDIIMISHDMLTIKEYCDKCVVLENGRLNLFEDVSEAIEFYREINR